MTLLILHFLRPKTIGTHQIIWCVINDIWSWRSPTIVLCHRSLLVAFGVSNTIFKKWHPPKNQERWSWSEKEKWSTNRKVWSMDLFFNFFINFLWGKCSYPQIGGVRYITQHGYVPIVRFLGFYMFYFLFLFVFKFILIANLFY